MTHDQRIRDHIAYAYQNAPAIRRILDGAGVKPSDIQGVDDLARIPVTSKDRLQELQQEEPPFGGFLAIPFENLSHIYISPGPIYEPNRDEANAEGALEGLRAAGLGKGDRVLNTFMYHLTPAGRLLDDGLRALGATVLPTGPGNTDLQMMLILRLNVTGFVGTPSFLATLFETAGKFGFNPKDLPLKKALFTAEPYPKSTRQRFDGEYGMTTVSAYGTADLGFIGYEIGGVDGFRCNPNLIVQICDPETGALLPDGEIGEIVCTTFDRHYPLIRFGTGDLGSLDPNIKDHKHLTGLYGRSGGAIKVRGMFLHPNQIELVMGKVPQIKYAQAVITRDGNRDHVTVRVQLKPEHSGADVIGVVKDELQTASRLKIDEVVVVEAGVIDPAQRSIRDERTWN